MVLVILVVDLGVFVAFEYIGSMMRIQWILCLSFMNLSFLALAMLSTAFPVYLNEHGVKDPNDPMGRRRRLSSVAATTWRTDDDGLLECILLYLCTCNI